MAMLNVRLQLCFLRFARALLLARLYLYVPFLQAASLLHALKQVCVWPLRTVVYRLASFMSFLIAHEPVLRYLLRQRVFAALQRRFHTSNQEAAPTSR